MSPIVADWKMLSSFNQSCGWRWNNRGRASANTTSPSRRSSMCSKERIVSGGTAPITKQKNIRILMLLVCLWFMKSPPDHHWGGRTQDWDTIQRIRAVLQARSKKHGGGVGFLFPPHSSARRLPESQQWSPDGAAKAGLIHTLLDQAGGWRNEEVEGALASR